MPGMATAAVNPCPVSTFFAPLNTPNVYVDLASPKVKIPQNIKAADGANVPVYLRAKVFGTFGWKGVASSMQKVSAGHKANQAEWQL